MRRPDWFERKFQFGIPPGMLPFFLERLEGTIARLEKKINSQPDTILCHKPDGKWSIKEHIGHLAEVDEIALRRIDEMVKGISPMTPAVFETKKDYNIQPATQLLNYFAKNRMENLRKYKTLSDGDCAMTSLHPRLKVMMSPVDLAFFDAEHDDHHLVKISEIQLA
jgi:hypothetical protein